MKLKSINKTIAVLPFVNMSASEDNEFFSDGITEEIINALAKIDQLKVTSRTSSFYFKDKKLPITEIGEQLKVSTILEGSVRLAGNMLRITAQLIQVEEDFHFWSETWDRKLENIFEVQDEISLLIADKLREHFGHFEIQEHLVGKQTKDVNAYEYCLKAKFKENKWNPIDVKEAITYYEKALELDENYSEAHLGLATCYSFLGTTGFMSFEEAWGKTVEYTNQANVLNGELSGVHYQLSNVAFFIECDYNKSLLEMKKAVRINPNNAEAQQFMSFLYVIAGEREQSKRHLELALSINPLSEETRFFKAYFHYMMNDYAKSLVLLNECLTVNDKNIPAHSVKASCLLKLGRYDEVINYFDQIPAEAVIAADKLGAIGLAYTYLKDEKQSEIYLNDIIRLSKEPDGFAVDSYLYLMYAALDRYDMSFEWVAKSLKEKASLLLIRYSDPLVGDLKNDPRYLEYHKQIFGLEEAILEKKKKKSLLDDKLVQEYKKRLLTHLSEHESYLESNLSLRILAEQIDIHPNQLSYLINVSFGKNFNELINQYRIEAFKSIAKEPKNAHLTIEGLAYESGFNSKTVFNTYFKKETGLTPKQFLKQ